MTAGSVAVLEMFNRAETSTAPTTQYTCAPSEATAITASWSCSVTLTAALTRGGAESVNVLSSGGAVIASVPLRIYYPSSVTVAVEDSELGAVAGVGVATSCSATRYQQTEATAVAAFGSYTSTADVSGLVSLSTSDTSVAAVSGGVVSGVAVGSASVLAGVAAAAL